MKAIRFLRSYFSALELALWGISTAMIRCGFSPAIFAAFRL